MPIYIKAVNWSYLAGDLKNALIILGNLIGVSTVLAILNNLNFWSLLIDIDVFYTIKAP
jgi:hypothetical protein